MSQNLNKWRLFMRECPSPESFIDYGFYFLISAGLQRRVWLDSASPIFPNVYIGLVGRAGLGKGLVTTPVKSFISHWKWDPNELVTEAGSVNGKALMTLNGEHGSLNTKDAERLSYLKQLHEELLDMQRDDKGRMRQKEKENLFPIAPDFITQQQLVKKMAEAKRRVDHGPIEARKIYTHSSMAFVLDELGNLFQENQRAMNAFLLTAYTCGDKYEHETITRKLDRITKPCITMIAGLTPDFMREVFTSQLLSEGFASRTWFIFESKPRFRQGFMPPPDAEQEQARKDILNHIRNLSTVFGPVTQTVEALEFFNAWWRNESGVVTNKSIKLEDYYARKLMHVYKLAMIELFSDQTTSMVIERWHIESAIQKLAIVEQKMHIALNFTDGRNPLAVISGRILKFLANCPEMLTTREALFVEFYSDLNDLKELDSCLDYLESAGAVGRILGRDGKLHVKGLLHQL